MEFRTKNYVTLLIGLLCMVGGVFAPEIFGLSQSAVRTLLFTIGVLIWLVTETMHMAIIAILMIVLQPVFGLTPSFGATAANCASPFFFFLIAAFIIAGAFQESGLSKRLLKFLLMKFGKTSKGAILAILLSTAILSSIIANLPALVLFYGVSIDFLTMYDDPAERKQTGKSLCIGLIYAALCGGCCTIVGNMNPMLAAAALSNAGYDVSFAKWMIVGLPIGILLFIVMTFILFKLFPPVEISAEKRQKFIDRIDVSEKMSSQEMWITLITLAMLICWILGSWVPVLNTVLVAVMGASFMLMPFFKIMDWPTANKYIAWPTILLTIGFISLAAVFTASGLTEWILGVFNSLVPEGTSITVMLLILGIVCVLTLLLISNGPALITILSAPFIELALSRGMNPAVLMIPLSMYMAYTVLLPIDTISLITYASDTYKMEDEFKAGILFSICSIIIISVAAPLLLNIVGLG